MSTPRFNKVINLTVLALLITLPITGSARDLVLVGNTLNIDNSFTKTELRKLFLGYRVNRNDKPIKAIRNTRSKDQYQIFLQSVMFMSKTDYERRCLTLNFSKGNSKVEDEKDFNELLTRLKDNKFTVSFMWRDEFAENDGFRIIQTLWQGEP